MINSPKGNRTDVSGVMFRKLLVLRSLHTCKQTSWRKEKMKNNNHKKFDKKKLIGTISKKHIKNGSYTMVMSVIFIAVVVVLNICLLYTSDAADD